MNISAYKWGAKFYDLFWRNFTARTLEHILLTLDFKQLDSQEQPKCLLDIACGTGELELRLVRLHPQIQLIGLDSSQEMLTQARRKLAGNSQVAFVEGNATLPLPFSTASFDVIISANALHYIAEPNKLLQEIKRTLKPGGQLVIEDFTVHGRFFWPIFERLIRLVDPQLYKTYSLAELNQFVKAAGFTIEGSGGFKIDLLWRGMFVIGN